MPIVLPHSGSAWHRALVVVFLCAALAAISASSSVHDAILQLLGACKEVIAAHPFAGPAAFMLFAAASALMAFVSVAVLVPVAIFAWGPLLAVLYLWSGWIIGGVFSYAIGRLLGRSLLLWLSPATSARLEHLLRSNGSLSLALLLQLSLPSELLGYALGSARFEMRRYVLVLALGELPYAIGAVALGESLVSGRSAMPLIGGVAIAGLIVLAFTVMHLRVQATLTPPEPVVSPSREPQS